MRKHVFWLLPVMIFVSCGNKNQTPAGVLKPDKMQAVLWDVIRADAFTIQFIKKDSSKNDIEENLKLQQKIFAIHHITKSEFYKSYDYYRTHGDLMKKMVDSMIISAERNKSIKAKPPKVD